MATWHFREKQPGEKERNPVTAHYFDEEAIDRPAQRLHREAIQKGLDARLYALHLAVIGRIEYIGSTASQNF